MTTAELFFSPLEGNNDGMAFYEPALHKSPTTMYLAPVSPLLGPQRLPYVGPVSRLMKVEVSRIEMRVYGRVFLLRMTKFYF